VNKPRITNNLPRFIQGVERKSIVAANQALTIGGSEVAAITPRDTSTMVNSEYKVVQVEGTRIVGRFAYTVPYAKWVHEMSGKLKGQPRAHFGKTRDGTQFGGGTKQGVYWGPSGEPHFVTKGFTRAIPNITGVLTGLIKT
jgi:hypothetical protein